MTGPPFRSERLVPSHDVSGFHCGNEVLEAWLRHLIENSELYRRLGRGDPRQIPAILLARLALGDELHGSGLGGVLLHDALIRAVAASQQAGGRYVVVDAMDDDAKRFYQHFGFTATPRQARLARKVSDIEADIKN